MSAGGFVHCPRHAQECLLLQSPADVTDAGAQVEASMGYQESAGRRLEAWVATYSSMLQPGFEIGGMKKPMSENLACRFEAEAGTHGSAPQHRNAMRVLVSAQSCLTVFSWASVELGPRGWL